MLRGRKYRLGKPALAMENANGGFTAFTLPEGAIVQVLSGPERRTTYAEVSVQWENKTLGMFAVDLEVWGTLLSGDSSDA